jgi:hypothetical protein
MRFVSTQTAITCAGLFVVSTLMKWGVRTILRSAVVETEELVTAAVNATGIPGERMYWTELTRIEYITVLGRPRFVIHYTARGCGDLVLEEIVTLELDVAASSWLGLGRRTY